jgi:peptidoglycan/LPS O-acetylase OafA/YrhL
MTHTRPLKHAKPILEHGVPERRYLAELHGVRGLALLGVVLFHLFGNGRVSGGIDIFLTVSGFLFTGMLLREAAATGGRVNPLKYYGRLIRRIVIPAAVVVVVTLLMGLLISPSTQHRQLWAEARSSLLYFENFELIRSQLAYGAAGPETSPFQHFWSLSVQGQFYIIWPALAIISVLIAKRFQKPAANVMGILTGLVLISSLLYAMYLSSYNQDEAYLSTFTRAWQLAFGGLLALAGGTIRLPQPLRGIGGWLGLALIVSCGFVLDGGQLFPGPWALWPILGVTLVLISAGPEGGNNDPTWSATRFLSNKVFAWIGDHAYGLYLWHWPLLIFYMELRDREAIGIRGGLVVLALTVLLAIVTNRYIERPLQNLGQKRPQARTKTNKKIVAIGASVLVASGLVMTAFTQPTQEVDIAYGDLDPHLYPGATQYFQTEPVPDAEPFPPLDDIDNYYADYAYEKCGQKGGAGPGLAEVLVCDDKEAPESPTATIVLAGGSHAGHLEGAFKNLARKYDWEILVVTKSRCTFGIEDAHPDSMCVDWSVNFVEWLKHRDVDLVVTPATRLDKPETEYIWDSAPFWWREISDTGTDLMLVRGMPRGEDIPDCLADGGTAQECGFPKNRFADANPLSEINLPDRVYQIDVSRYVCPQLENPETENCDAIVGNIIMSYDDNHLTSVFSHTLAPAFETEMQDVVPHLLR